MKTLSKFLIFFFFLSASMAQERTITGIVTSASDGLPLPGVNVVIKNSTAGVQTNFDGKYKITAKKGDTLVFTFIGMITQEVKIDTHQMINVQLVEDSSHLEEVVVIAYGTTTNQRSMVSNHIRTKDLNKAEHERISNHMKGRVAGVTVTGSNGSNPGVTNEVKIRGVRSLTKVKDPLYIVDGLPIHSNHTGLLNNLKSNQIKKVKVLKSSKAQNLYGSSAKNGCVIITTAQGNFRVENDEKYAEITENKFERTNLSPLSTFSIDVDKASYSNIRRMMNNAQNIPVDAVKIEEMINYFTYNYPQPTDEHPFSINTEAIQTPWNPDTKLVKIGLQGKKYENNELPASNLTFLIDVSGSMSGYNKLPLLKSAFKLLVNQLRPKDKVSIVVYAGAAGMVLKPTSGDNKKLILSALDNLNAGGSTAGGAGIELAYKIASKNFIKDGNNRVILATDGDFNVGESSDSAMEKLIEEKRKTGVFLSVLGFGYGNLKDSKLETLADKGNGNHAYIDSMQEAQKVFGQEFGGTLYTIAKDVKIQVEFNPAIVQAYRLIGYENRLLADEDFIDDTKDAGELGSGHTVTALYEVIPTGINSPYLKDVAELKYSKIEISESDNKEMFTVKFRYKRPDENKSIEMVHVQNNELSEPSSDFKFASAVALLGMKLRNSSFDNNMPYNRIITLARDGKGNDVNGYRSEFIRLVESYQGL